jgi:hypothetical protein
MICLGTTIPAAALTATLVTACSGTASQPSPLPAASARPSGPAHLLVLAHGIAPAGRPGPAAPGRSLRDLPASASAATAARGGT